MDTLLLIIRIFFIPVSLVAIIVGRYRDEVKHFKNFTRCRNDKYDMIASYRGLVISDKMKIISTRVIKMVAFDYKIVIMKRRTNNTTVMFEIKADDIIAIDYKRIYTSGLHLEILHRSDKIPSPYKIEFRRDIDDELIDILDRLDG